MTLQLQETGNAAIDKNDSIFNYRTKMVFKGEKLG